MEKDKIKERLLSSIKSIYLETSGRKIEAVTNAGRIFDKEVTNVFNFADFVVKSVGAADDLIKQIQSDEREQDDEKNIIKQRTDFYDRWVEFGQMFLQMIICRLVDNYSIPNKKWFAKKSEPFAVADGSRSPTRNSNEITNFTNDKLQPPATAGGSDTPQFFRKPFLFWYSYLSEVIRETIPSKPEILKSGEQVKLDYILRFDSMSEFLTDLIERKVTNLSYGGFSEIEKWCIDKLGLSLVENEKERIELIELIETRNLFVHNRGKIGDKYMKNLPHTNFTLGQERLIDVDYLVNSITLVLGCGMKFDERISAKFNLSL